MKGVKTDGGESDAEVVVINEDEGQAQPKNKREAKRS